MVTLHKGRYLPDRISNEDAWGVGEWDGAEFFVRKVVWGRQAARAERREREQIIRLTLEIAQAEVRAAERLRERKPLR